jgi:hypothetical protein
MTQETGFPRARFSGTLQGGRAGRGKQYIGVPLVLSSVGPFKSMVPGRVRKSLVTPPDGRTFLGWRSRLGEYPLFSHALGRLPAMAFTPITEETAMPRSQRRPTRAVTTPVLHPHAAGVDVGATECRLTGTRSLSCVSGPSPRTWLPWPRGSRSAGPPHLIGHPQ